jgi:acetyl coenzyme A synthetase (ADP forming)-like protein
VADYPEEFDFDVVLKDGDVIRMRPIRPSDADLEAEFIGRVGPESMYYRFFRYRSGLSDEELEYFTNVDYENRMAFVAQSEGDIIAIGRYDLLEPESDGAERAAEVAFLVEDAHQGRGIGTLLLQHLTTYARLQGIAYLRAYVLSDNSRMMELFRSAGYGISRRNVTDGVHELELPTVYSEEARIAEAEYEKRSVSASLSRLFRPRSVAVIGASRDAESIGGRLFHNLVAANFEGPVYPVNPSAAVVRSVKAYPSVLEIPDEIDTAFIAVPAPYVKAVVEECAEKGVKAVVVISAGFSETGDEGRALEEDLVATVRSAGMRMVGPNCMGFLNTDPSVRLNGQFGPVFPPPGNVAISSQSGALGLAILDYARQINVGVSSFVSVGNKADVTGNDLMLYWEDDPATEVILLYLESFGSPRRFARTARRIAHEKPIVAVKSGRSKAGARAAASHTGALADVEVAVEALFRQTGVIRTDTLNDMFDVTSLLAHQPVPTGRRVAVLTNAGGPAILCADALEAEGMELPQLSATLQERLRQHLPAAAATGNPVDMIAAAGPVEYSACLEALLDSDEVDAVIPIYIPASPGGSEAVAKAVKAASTGAGDKAVLSVFMQWHGAPTVLSQSPGVIPTFPYPERAARALAAAVKYGEWRARPQGQLLVHSDVDHEAAGRVVSRALGRLGDGGGWLDPGEIEMMLGAFGIATVRSTVVTSADEAVAFAEQVGGPVVLKVISPTVLHKTDIGGVVLDVEGADEVRDAYAAVTSVAADASGALIQEFVTGHEVIIGMTEDPTFGPLIAFGLGGVFVELLQDVAFRIHPLTDVDVDEMLGELRSARLLEGYRGGAAGDIEAVKEALGRVSVLVDHFPEIVEMDLNPVMVRQPGEGIRVVDARIRIEPREDVWLPSRKDIPGVAHRSRRE